MNAVSAPPAAPHEHHEHHAMPTSGSALTSVAISATLHCLTGCAIGEVLGMVIGTALGFSDLGTVALAVALAFVFGYGLTSLPLLRAGLPLAAVVPIALASDTFSIATMEVVDNAIMLAIPGAMEAGLDSELFWGALAVALVIAGVVALPVNRWLIARGKGHAVVHETGIHGGPSPRVVGVVAAVAFVFGASVLTAQLVDGDAASGGHGTPSGHGASPAPAAGGEASSTAGHDEQAAAAVRGLRASADGLTLRLSRSVLPRGRRTPLRLRILTADGAAVRDFDVEHEKRMHLIVVRVDLAGFQHLHPTMRADGTWSVPLTLAEAGRYRVFADFKHAGRNETLAGYVRVDGPSRHVPLPAAAAQVRTSDGYGVRLRADHVRAGEETTLRFVVTRRGRPVAVEPYLGARGHLVALRAGDLAYLHVHPTDGHGSGAAPVSFATTFPTTGRYRLFLQFKHAGRVHTAAFTRTAGAAGGSAQQPHGSQPHG